MTLTKDTSSLLKELADRLMDEAVEYRRLWESKSPKFFFDLDYFKKFIKAPLLNEFDKKVRFRLKSMTKEDAGRFLSREEEQFCRYALFEHKNELKQLFWKKFWHPNSEPAPYVEMEQTYSAYFLSVFNAYQKHFYRYQNALDLIIQDFENGFLETAESQQTGAAPKFKLSTNLTVAELAYLFRTLHEKGIIQCKPKTDLYRFVCDNFSSKQEDTISEKSLSNRFNNPEYNAIDHWQEIFYQLGEKARKDKKNK